MTGIDETFEYPSWPRSVMAPPVPPPLGVAT